DWSSDVCSSDLKIPIINTEEMLKEKIEMLETLRDMEIATNLLRVQSDSKEDPIDANYQKLKTDITPIEKDEEEHKLVSKYVQNTHGSTHNYYTLELIDLFRVSRHGESERYKKYKDLHNKQLLWHGSRITNFGGILSQGLRIAPPEAPVTGYMFGKGIYFADMVSKDRKS